MLVALVVIATSCMVRDAHGHDYRAALAMSLLYFEGQRSGRLPPAQRVQWRADSALADGADHRVRHLASPPSSNVSVCARTDAMRCNAGGPHRRLLRLRRQRQVRAPHGVHGGGAGVERRGVRRPARRGGRAGPRARRRAVGRRLPRQGARVGRRRRRRRGAVRAGRRRRLRPLVLAASRGHGHAPHGLHGDRLQPRLRRRRRDGRRARRRAHARRRQLLVHAPGARQTGTTFLHAQCNLI